MNESTKRLFALLKIWAEDSDYDVQILAISSDKTVLRQMMKENVLETEEEMDAGVSRDRPYTWKVNYDLKTEDEINLTHEPWGIHYDVNWYWSILEVPVV